MKIPQQILAVLVLLPALVAPIAADAPIRGMQVFATDGASGQLEPVTLYNRMLALVIGIDSYADSDIDLTYAVNDAKAVAHSLKRNFRFARVDELYNAAATRTAIVSRINEIARDAGDDDAVFIFFAGHGTQLGDGDNAVGYLLPHDGAFAEQDPAWSNNISMNVIKHDWSNLIRAKHVFYVMDACYSGLMATRDVRQRRTEPADLPYLREITSEPVRIVLTAGQAGQTVLDGGDGSGHSVFTSRFLDALQREQDFVTALELAADLKRKVAADARARGHTQTPDYARLVGLGDFVFVSRVESLEELQQQLTEIEDSLRQMEGRGGTVEDARRRQERADLQARMLTAKRRDDRRRQLATEAKAAEAEAEERRQQELEIRRKLSEARAREAAAAAQNMTISAALTEIRNILERMTATEADVDAGYAATLKELQKPKDLFETTGEYEARQAEHRRLLRGIPMEKEQRLAGFREALDLLNNKEFLIDRADIGVSFHNYDADSQLFMLRATHGAQNPVDLICSIPPRPQAESLHRALQDSTLIVRAYARLHLDAAAALPGTRTTLTRVECKELDAGVWVFGLDLGLGQLQPPRTVPDLGLELVWIKPGTFMMGSPKKEKNRDLDETRHRVTLTKGFWLGKYEVTQAQYKAVTGKNPSKSAGANRPVENVSWGDAVAFCRKLTERERRAGRLPGNGEYRLPTEAEWEYACRAGTVGKYAGELDAMAWHGGNSSQQTHEVGRKRPNAWGLYDMHGNVWEWCADWYGDYPTGAVTDPTGSERGPYRVYRGGCWADPPPGSCSSALRPWPSPGGRRYYLGFRLLRTVP